MWSWERPVVFSEDRNKDILAEGRLKRAAEIVQRFGPEKMQHKDAFTSVAYGLGLSASMFF
jgi:hypothetical protein